MNEMKPHGMVYDVNCGICAKPLVYVTESTIRTCSLCAKVERASIYCPAGHYICDSCHSKTALDILRQELSSAVTADPGALLEHILSHPAVPMHGPEHHAIVPAVIVAAVRNSGCDLPESAVEQAIERGSKIPAGWCGLYGNCGAAVGVGIAVSVITGATPLKGIPRTHALAATSSALSQMLDRQTRCCKRASRIAIRSAVDFLREHLEINLDSAEVKCVFPARNEQCVKNECPFY